MYTAESWGEIISLAVVPTVLIAACGLLCLAFYHRLSLIVTRLRTLQNERLQEYKEVFRYEDQKKPKLVQHEAQLYLKVLEDQTAKVLKRAAKVRNCLICLIISIGFLIFCSLCIGLSKFHHFFGFASVFFFILSMLVILVGLYFAFDELTEALHPIQMESQFMQKLIKTELENQDLRQE